MIIQIFLIVFPIFLVLLVMTALVHLLFMVPYVPTKNSVVKKMIAAAHLKPNETVYDLGCGDGRLLIAAEKNAGVKTVGFEIAPLVFLLSQIRKFLSRARAKIHFRSFFNADLRPADVIFCYLFPNVMPRLASKIKHECRRGTRIISNTFHIPGLKPSRVLEKDPTRGIPTIYVYEI